MSEGSSLGDQRGRALWSIQKYAAVTGWGGSQDFVAGGLKADFQLLDFAGPAVFVCLSYPFLETGCDGLQSIELCRVDPEDRAADAGVFVFTAGPVRAGAGT